MSKPFFEVFPTLKVKDDIPIQQGILSVSAFTADI